MRYAAWLINKNPQHARLASAAQLDFHNFHTQRSSHALRNRMYLIQVNCHKNSGLASPQCPRKAVQVKSGLAPTGVFRQSWYYTAVPVVNIRWHKLKDQLREDGKQRICTRKT